MLAVRALLSRSSLAASAVLLSSVAACQATTPPAPEGFDAAPFDLPLRADLGEHLVDDEAAIVDDTRNTLLQLVEQKHQQGVDARDVHAKSHGCARARFVVDADVPGELRHGLFAAPASYEAVVRFSTSEPLPKGDDWNPSLKGIGIKVRGVDGARFALDDERDTQDFAFNNRPAFPLKDVVDYAAAMRVRRDGGLVAGLFVATHLYAVPQLVIEQNLVNSPLRTTFWSQTPIAVGDVATKMAVRPCRVRHNRVPTVRDPRHGPDYLKETVQAELSSSSACFDFLVQQRPSLPAPTAAAGSAGEDAGDGALAMARARRDARFPVEDASVAWPEDEAPFVRVARLTLPQQSLDDDAAFAADCDALRFTPWHALLAHRPLGSLNRARKTVYEVLSRHRLQRASSSSSSAPSTTDSTILAPPARDGRLAPPQTAP